MTFLHVNPTGSGLQYTYRDFLVEKIHADLKNKPSHPEFGSPQLLGDLNKEKVHDDERELERLKARALELLPEWGTVVDQWYQLAAEKSPKDGLVYLQRMIVGTLMENTMPLRNLSASQAMVSEDVANPAALAQPVHGGIDLDSKNLKLDSEGQAMNIKFTPAMMTQFKQGNFDGVRIKVLDVIPVSIMPLLGFKEEDSLPQLAQV